MDSGGGKSTLVDAIAGYRPATQGKVFVNGVDVYRHFDAVRNNIGFVPQKDIIHTELTVFQALDYSAQRAILDAQPFPPLPPGFPKNDPEIEFLFDEERLK